MMPLRAHYKPATAIAKARSRPYITVHASLSRPARLRCRPRGFACFAAAVSGQGHPTDSDTVGSPIPGVGDQHDNPRGPSPDARRAFIRAAARQRPGARPRRLRRDRGRLSGRGHPLVRHDLPPGAHRAGCSPDASRAARRGDNRLLGPFPPVRAPRRLRVPRSTRAAPLGRHAGGLADGSHRRGGGLSGGHPGLPRAPEGARGRGRPLESRRQPAPAGHVPPGSRRRPAFRPG